MGRLQSDVHAIDRLIKLDRSSVLSRCDEILRAVYSDTDVQNKKLSPDQILGISRILFRLGLVANDVHDSTPSVPILVSSDFSPRFAQNLARHSSACCTPASPQCGACPLVSFCQRGMKRSGFAIRRKPIAIDLFAGAGALSAAFRREGFRVGLAVEKDRHAAQSYRVNNPGVPVIEADARNVSPRDVLAVLGCKHGEISATIAGPPCQGYSAAGPRRPMARRNFFYRYIADFAKAVGSSLLVMENVPGLKQVNGVRFTERILREFRRCGFPGKDFEVDASNFGVPQRRKRLFFICARQKPSTASLRLHPLKLRKKPTVLTALGGLPRPRVGKGADELRLRGKLVYNHRAMKHSKRVVKKIKRIEVGEGPISYRRLGVDLAHTIIAGHRAMPVHPRQHRTITVREAARLQTVPDAFRFLGPHSEQPLQVANVVPYLLARAIARALLLRLKSKVNR